MRPTNMKNATLKTLFLALMVAITLLLTPASFAAAPGISAGTGGAVTFSLTAQDSYLNQPDGEAGGAKQRRPGGQPRRHPQCEQQ